ncbi:PREDICTED: immediate early response gene 5-like protein [Nicrophorus vespilloides]|uniref:Immediate early response gene 5-like protein n=1 Tax=Nicrophorus vespilloides TaxID=110193 RepID=A0ABM1N2Y6_NICVS|nr:PREDICTED: immediate early response gene 5-like protein [Nicrophorus vespilloides]
MASEAQRLIGISLTKIAQSRTHRGGVSLHKNLLVATVLQKARYIFMEEAYNMVHYQAAPVVPQREVQEELVGLTAEEAGVAPMTAPEEPDTSSLDFLQPGCAKCGQDKENQPPTYHTAGELTYLDLDKTPSVLKERSNCLKRRRAVTEWETEEAVQSILPKRRCTEEGDDSVFLDDATLLSDTVAKEIESQEATASTSSPSTSTTTTSSSTMEIERITSLVSIFSFGMGENGKLNRSVSTPDLCSSQAKDVADSIQQRPFLAMTV